MNDVNRSTEFTPKPFDESSPVFLIGFPRSGTTLLDQILNTSSVIETLEEKPLVQKMLIRFQAHGFSYPKDLNLLNFELVEDLKNAYFQEVSSHSKDRPETIMIDKLPLNTIDMGLIHRVFPKSKMIFALRHPADTCLSCFFQNFSLNEAMIHFLDLTDTAKFYGMVMDLWHNYTKILSLDYHVVRYEDLVSDFEGETKKLFQFLKVPWERSVYEYNSQAKTKQKITTPSYHQVVEPLYKRSMYRWKNYAAHLKPIFEILEPHIRKFGYSLNEDMGKRQNIVSAFNAQCPV